MDGYEEKKWFVYLGDHHEGPFSLGEIQAKMNEGLVTPSSYVWAEGMSDWKLMPQVPAFEGLLQGGYSPALQAFPEVPVAMATEPAAVPEPVLEEPVTLETVRPQSVQLTASRPELDPAPRVTEEDLRGTRRDEYSEASEAKPRGPLLGRLFKLLLLLGILGGAGVGAIGVFSPELLPEPVRGPAQAAVTAARALFSPLPSLEDVAPEDFEELKAAAGAKLDKDGPRIAVALSTADLLSPAFYVATNLPDGTVIDLYVEGVTETLLNQLAYSSRVRAVVAGRLAKTPALKFAENKSLPRGQYELYAIEGEEQPEEVKSILASLPPASFPKAPAAMPKNFKLAATKGYFLGGAKDGTYTARLKEFHDKLREKATRELVEIKQFHGTLEATMNAGLSDFNLISRMKAAAIRQKKWEEHHQKWQGFATQMNDIFGKWTPAVLESEFFYGSLYSMIQQAFQGVEQLHNLHHSYFTASVDAKAFEIQAGQVAATASAALANLKAKIEQAEKIPPAPNGMPRRDGL
ncbi:MAG: DUF4339 domain-containing protein [Oligoflexia bacterium]|nr:DUF4339 domain-containing protein [Oligoflexia bacterium]